MEFLIHDIEGLSNKDTADQDLNNKKRRKKSLMSSVENVGIIKSRQVLTAQHDMSSESNFARKCIVAHLCQTL